MPNVGTGQTYILASTLTDTDEGWAQGAPQWMTPDQYAAASAGGVSVSALSPNSQNAPAVPAGGTALTPIGDITSQAMGIGGTVFTDPNGNYWAGTTTKGFIQIGNQSGITVPATGQVISPQVLQSNINSTAVAQQEASASGTSTVNDLGMLAAAGITAGVATGFGGLGAAADTGAVAGAATGGAAAGGTAGIDAGATLGALSTPAAGVAGTSLGGG